MLQLFATQLHIVHNDSARSSTQWHISSKAKPFLIKSGHGTHVDGHFKDIATVWRETLVGGNVGKLSVIRQTKTIQISTYN